MGKKTAISYMGKTLWPLLGAICSTANAITIQYEDEPYRFLEEERVVIQAIADAAELEVRELLPALDEELVLVVKSGKYVIEQNGDAGMVLSAGKVQWMVDHERAEGVIAIAEDHLRHTLFHEFHHLVRGWLVEGGRPKTSFMVGVVSEGLATAFARDFAGEVAPWAAYPDDVDSWVCELQNIPVTGARYDHRMFLHPDGRRWIGYRAGTYLVERAMNASGKTAVDLVTTSADAIVRMGQHQ